jgi:hypothetical protein
VPEGRNAPAWIRDAWGESLALYTVETLDAVEMQSA